MKSAPIIIGLVGPSGAGKTSVCDYIQSLGFMKIHAATPLKRGVRSMFGCSEAYTERPLIDQPADFLGGVEMRQVLEHLGDKLNEIAPRAIPLTIQKRLVSMKRLGRPWILVDGVRRRAESDVIHAQGGKMIRIEGKEVDPSKPCDLTQLAVDADYTVLFSPTLSELHRQLDEVLVKLLPPGALDDAKRK